MIQVELRLFGKFKKYDLGQKTLPLEFKAASTVQDVKAALARYLVDKNPGFSDQLLIEDSAIADEKNILMPGDLIQKSCTLAILPPVCGG